MNVLDRVSRSSMSLVERAFSFFAKSDLDSDLITTLPEALRELEQRRCDPSLQGRVEEYLNHDIPEYFGTGPILYLSRYIVTPNFETIRFLYLTREIGLPVVATQDSKGLFVSQNQVKRALGKLSICTRLTQKEGKLHEQYENISVVDFNTEDGKLFSDIRTFWGEPLIDFHSRLFSELGLERLPVPDDAGWIDRHGRGNLLEHYTQLLSLFVTHGIFFENYNTNDPHEREFIRKILRPAFRAVERRFGYHPLIVPVFPTTFESHHFWISYPNTVLEVVRKSL